MNYIIMLVAGILGIFLYSLRKIKGIRKRQPEALYNTVFVTYWKSEWDTVALSIVVVVTCLFLSNEYLNLPADTPNPIGFTSVLITKITLFIKTVFVIIGYCANSLVDVFLGTTEATLQKKAKDGGVNEN